MTLPPAEEMKEDRGVSWLGLIPRLGVRRETGRREREEKNGGKALKVEDS